MQSRVRTDAWHGKEQLELLQNAVGFSLWSVFQFSQNALFHFLWHCRHLRNSWRTSVDFGRLKNNSIIWKCSQFRVNLLITFYPDQPQKIVVIPPLIERRLHYLNVAQSTCVFARSQPAVFQSGLRAASITDSSERSIKPSIVLVLTTPPPIFCIWTINATSSLHVNTLLLPTYIDHTAPEQTLITMPAVCRVPRISYNSGKNLCPRRNMLENAHAFQCFFDGSSHKIVHVHCSTGANFVTAWATYLPQ